MKKILNLIVCMVALFPFTNVFAAQLQCGKGETLESNVKSFKCVNINGDTLTFTHTKNGNTEDYSKYFKIDEDDKSIVRIVDDSFLKKYDSSSEVIVISISDGSSTAGIAIKNPNYIVPTTTETTTTTTTTNPNAKVYNVILQDGEEKTEKKCEVTDNNDTCSISLPQITKEGFNGWGTADGCKEGSRGTIKVDKDTTYYACYNNASSSKEDTQKLYLNSLKLTDKDTKKEIKFGTFSIKKNEYEFKVLNEVENIEVEAEADDGITVEVEGNEGLKEGKNEIVITLKDEEDNEATYTLKVTRLKKGETISSVHYLKSLIIGGVDNFKFDKNTFNYTVTIDNKLKSLEINTETENEEDKVQIVGNSNLEDGSVVKIFVLGEDGEKTIYNINVVKEGGINILVIVVGVILVIILILTVLIFLKSNKKNNDNTQKKEKTKKEKKNKKTSNKPDVLGSNNASNDNIEVLKF